jgi:hypothetical protein
MQPSSVVQPQQDSVLWSRFHIRDSTLKLLAKPTRMLKQLRPATTTRSAFPFSFRLVMKCSSHTLTFPISRHSLIPKIAQCLSARATFMRHRGRCHCAISAARLSLKGQAYGAAIGHHGSHMPHTHSAAPCTPEKGVGVGSRCGRSAGQGKSVGRQCRRQY